LSARPLLGLTEKAQESKERIKPISGHYSPYKTLSPRQVSFSNNIESLTPLNVKIHGTATPNRKHFSSLTLTAVKELNT